MKNPQIVDDIEILVQFGLSNGEDHVDRAAKRVEAWLATMPREDEREL